MHINALEQMVVDLIASQKLQRQLAENIMTKKESKLEQKLEQKLDKLELQNQEFKEENVRLKLDNWHNRTHRRWMRNGKCVLFHCWLIGYCLSNSHGILCVEWVIYETL